MSSLRLPVALVWRRRLPSPRVVPQSTIVLAREGEVRLLPPSAARTPLLEVALAAGVVWTLWLQGRRPVRGRALPCEACERWRGAVAYFHHRLPLPMTCGRGREK